MTLEASLLDALAGGQVISGQGLARRLGVSRTAVWKAVRRLQAQGLDVTAVPGSGYRLDTPVDPLDPEAVRARLGRALGERLAHLDVRPRVDSTSTRVLAAAPEGPGLAVCVADYQTAGRGRRGRRWLSPPGAGVCLSVACRLAQAPSGLGGLALAVGVATVAALERLGAAGLALKWPNDLLWKERKLGGILIELRGEAQGPTLAAVGVGINHRFPQAARRRVEDGRALPPADLAEICGHPPPRAVVATEVVTAVDRALVRFESGGLDAFRDDFARLDALRGRQVHGAGPAGGQSGIARGVDDMGALLLEQPDGSVIRVTAGEVSVRPEP
ncbi:MAG: biotin--[acetyl-CoA-carboxylase] ligase [Gammaproteobacteria bacterium]